MWTDEGYSQIIMTAIRCLWCCNVYLLLSCEITCPVTRVALVIKYSRHGFMSVIIIISSSSSSP